MSIELPSLIEENNEQPANNVPAKKDSTAVELAPNEVALKIQTSMQKAETNWPLIKEKSVKAQAALSSVQVIENDEQDAAAETIVKRVVKTYQEISKMRLEITAPLDEIKDKVIEPEKKVSNLKGHDSVSELARVTKLRNAYANVKLEKKRKEEAAALATQNENFEIARIKAELQTSFTSNVTDYAANAEITMLNFFNGLLLEKPNPENPEKPITWDDQVKKFNMTPKLKETTFNTWFDVDYDKSKLSVEKYKELIESVKKLYTFELINAAYVKVAQPKVDEFKAKLPAKKKELLEMDKLFKKDKKAAETLRLKQEKENKDAVDKVNADATLAKQESAAKIKKQQNQSKLGASFEALTVTQNQEDIKTKRIPIITATDPQGVFEAMAQCLFHAFSKPEEFEGVFKKDKATGALLAPDENGMPVYNAWAKTLLEFVAKNTDAQIEGITFKEVAVSTVARDKKDKAE